MREGALQLWPVLVIICMTPETLDAPEAPDKIGNLLSTLMFFSEIALTILLSANQ
jgi:hypothetical protein